MSQNQPTYAELLAKVNQLEAESQARKSKALSVKRSEKGGVSVYGLQRFPVTLYYEQWERLLDFAPEIRKFIVQNKPTLSAKPE